MDFSSEAIRRKNLALAIYVAFFLVIALVFAFTGGAMPREAAH
ncbi:MAG: hypothetical protein NT002_00815 [candidate division Zixibacteria bacterium]|nr:hypothetical protein [candidate division Zixibacteria bacterium]